MAVDQALHFLGGAVAAKAPGVNQVGVEVHLPGSAVQAIGQGAQQAALQDWLGFGGLVLAGGGVGSQQVSAQQAAEQQGRKETQHWSTPWAGVSGAGLLKELRLQGWESSIWVCCPARPVRG